MQIIPRTLFSDKHTYAANTTTKTDLPRNARLQRLILRVTGTVDTSSATRADDGLHNILKALRVRRNGSDPLFNIPAKYVHYLNLVDEETRPEFTDVPASGTATGSAFAATYIIDFRSDPKNAHDAYGAVNAKDASQLTLEIDWGAASDLGTGYSNLAASVLVTQVEVFMNEAEENSVYGAKGSGGMRANDRVLYRTYTQKTIDAAYNSYQFPLDLPTGNILRDCFMFVRRAGARDDTQVTAFKVKQNAPVPLDLQEWDWTMSQSLDRQDYRIPTAVDGSYIAKGFAVVDFTDQGHLDLRNAKKGDAQLLCTTIAPSGTTDLTLVSREWAPAKA